MKSEIEPTENYEDTKTADLNERTKENPEIKNVQDELTEYERRQQKGKQIITQLRQEIKDLTSEIEGLENLKIIEARKEKAYNFVNSINGLNWYDIEPLFDFTDESKFNQTFDIFVQMQQSEIIEPSAGFGRTIKKGKVNSDEYGRQLARKTFGGKGNGK